MLAITERGGSVTLIYDAYRESDRSRFAMQGLWGSTASGV